MSDLDFSHLIGDQLEQALDGPALPPPPGVSPNYDRPGNEDAVSLFALFFCLLVATIALGLRLYARFFRLRKSHLGDYLIIPGYVFFLIVIVGSLRRIFPGPGLFVHQWNLRGRDVAEYLSIIFEGVIFYSVSLLLVKTSILIEWIQVFVPHTRNRFYWAALSILTFHLTFYVGFLIAFNLACTPYKRNWDKTIPGHCFDIRILSLASAIINLVEDIAILILPQTKIWGLKISSRKKRDISAVFAIGVLACVAAGFRIQSTVAWIKSRDMSFHFSAISLWAIGEITAAILVFSIPVAPMALKGFTFIDKLKKSKRGSREQISSYVGLPASRSRHYHSLGEERELNHVTRETPQLAPPIYQTRGIMRTTEITTSETRVNHKPDKLDYELDLFTRPRHAGLLLGSSLVD
ncbi:hypothetical protein F4678DRAFT_480372 [Xylaria arbuscula]|nr:hypothetical protein F4678DRAFT_480372 [Xylaria arbuscula]